MMTCAIGKHDLVGIVDEIFFAMAGMKLAPETAISGPDRRGAYIVSAVQIVGEWQGAVRLDIDFELMREACSRLLAVDAAALSPADIRDGAGELANITAGCVKALLAPTCNLSLPSVVIGRDYEFCVFQGKLVLEASFAHQAGKLLVSVLERQRSS